MSEEKRLLALNSKTWQKKNKIRRRGPFLGKEGNKGSVVGTDIPKKKHLDNTGAIKRSIRGR